MGASQGRPYERDLPMRRQEREEWMIELVESEDINGLKRFIAKETNQTYLHTTDEDRHTTLYHQSQHGDRIAHLKEKGPTDIPSLDDDENSQSVSSTSTSFHLPDIDPTLLIHSNVADGYTCGICLLLIRGAVILPCRHEYCLSCVDNIRESFSTRNDSSVELCGQRVCPYCRTKFLPTDVRPSFETRRRLQQLELHCPNHSMHGCQWIGTVDELPHHLTNLCEHESITCQRCGKKLNREQSKDHECAVDAMVDFESKSKKITNRSTQSASSSSSSLSSSAPAFASSSLFYPLTYSSPLNAYCLRVGDSFTILHQSVVMSSPSFIRSLLIEGCNPNIRSRGPLDISTHHQSPDEMDAVFYSNSTDVLIRSHRKSLEVKRYTDRTEKYLNSNIKYREIGFTPLMLAVIFAADDVVCEVCQILIAFGADLNSTTTYSNWSTIMFAATRRHPLLYSTLCDYGADTSMRNTEGHHALDVAHVWGGRKCVEMVENEAARRSKMRYELEQILGGRVQMAQVCIELIQQYAGLFEMK